MKTAIVLYAPVIHQGYLNFLKSHGSAFIPVFLMGESIFEKLKKNHLSVINPVTRDMRALPARDIALTLCRLYEGFVQVLEEQDIPSLHEYDKLILPEDESGHAFVEEYQTFFERVQFVSWFLRWDMPTSTTRTDIKSDCIITADALTKLGFFKHMEKARKVACQSPDWWRQVGSVLVRDGEEILSAHNTHLPTVYEVYYSGDPRTNFNAGESIEISKAIHSEASIIACAAQHGIVTKGCELYVTTFPCPACANLIALSGITRVYFADGYSLVGAIDVLRAYGVEVVRVLP